MTPKDLAIASNQGEFGGGEVMLLEMAVAARRLGYKVTIVAPSSPSDVLNAARDLDFAVAAIPGTRAREYLVNLRRWDKSERQGLLWCNGLRPALATAGHRNRVVHLHQAPSNKHKILTTLARKGALRTVVPSAFLESRVPGAIILENWSSPMTARQRQISLQRRPFTVGYLGRLSADKGVNVLCDAVQKLINEGQDIHLLLSGTARFVDEIDASGVKEKIASLGDRAHCTGWSDRTEFFESVDIAVFPSIAPESFGLVAAEAMAARCPFIVSDAGALPGIVGPDYPYVTKAGDVDALAECLRRAMTSDWEEQLSISRNRWEREFSPEQGEARLARVLNELSQSEWNIA